MADFLQLEIVTPERLVEKDTVSEVEIPGRDGYIGVLPGHAPLITELGVGEIRYRGDGMEYRLAVAWGFAEVLPDKVTILAETAERAQEIDINRARQAKERAEEHLREANDEEHTDQALDELARAENRITVAESK
jgi:F-type H+-transporting ATPase subunit epsilon